MRLAAGGSEQEYEHGPGGRVRDQQVTADVRVNAVALKEREYGDGAGATRLTYWLVTYVRGSALNCLTAISCLELLAGEGKVQILDRSRRR